jgi:hypothetical protein
MSPVAPARLADLFALSGVTLGTVWLLVRLAKAIVPSAADYLSRRRLLRTIEKLAASPPPARIELTSQGFVFDPYLGDAPVSRPGSVWLLIRSSPPRTPGQSV